MFLVQIMARPQLTSSGATSAAASATAPCATALPSVYGSSRGTATTLALVCVFKTLNMCVCGYTIYIILSACVCYVYVVARVVWVAVHSIFK